MFTRYVMEDGLLGALCGISDKIRRAWAFAPELRDMCDECGSELFLVLPRITLLSFFENPAGQSALIARLLPKCFESSGSPSGSLSEATRVTDKSLLQFMDRFEHT